MSGAGTLVVPNFPAVPFPQSVVTPVGPAPRGQSASIETGLDMTLPGDEADADGYHIVIQSNYTPKPMDGAYADTMYHAGLPVWVNVNNRAYKGNVLQPTERSRLPPTVFDSILGLNVLNLLLRQEAQAAHNYVTRRGGPNPNPNVVAGVDLELLKMGAEPSYTEMVDKVADMGLINSPSNHILGLSVQGFRRTHNYLGFVEVPNSDLPPSMGGMRAAFALNVSQLGVTKIPTPNFWMAKKGDHCYNIYKLWKAGENSPKQVAIYPWAGKDPFVPQDVRLYDNWDGSEAYGEIEYVGQAVDVQGTTDERTRLTACGLSEEATPALSDGYIPLLGKVTMARFQNQRWTTGL